MRITLRNRNYARRHLLAGHHAEFVTYQGELVDAPNWSVPGTIALTTGDSEWPVRLIDPEVIVSINDDIVPVQKAESQVRVIEVAGTKPGTEYQVTVSAHGRTCSCPGFTYRKSCRHISCEVA
jgi:hypothetical protein